MPNQKRHLQDRSRRRATQALLSSMLLISVLFTICGCGRSVDKASAEKARAELAARNLEFTTNAFNFSVTKGDTSAVELFLSGGMDANASDPDAKGVTPLMLAGRAGHNDIVKLLLAKGANPEAQLGRIGGTALMNVKSKEIAELLLAGGAKIGSKDKQGTTALLHASSQGKEGVARLLVERGANVNETDGTGMTALMHAASQDQTEVIQMLLAKNAKIDAQDENGRTALMYASVSPPRLKAVKLLVEKGASSSIRDKTGKSAMDYVEEAIKAITPER